MSVQIKTHPNVFNTSRAKSAATALMFGSAFFLSAFLIFLVQPMIAKRILPWFGGGPAVWTACLLFFQAVLLGGYFYAYVLDKLSMRTQGFVHSTLLVLALFSLPITPNSAMSDAGFSPALEILALLATSVGLPYVLLSATGPLLQKWLARSSSTVPYRWYAISNLGSLVGLMAYPLIIEPALSLGAQTQLWSALFFGCAILIASVGFLMIGAERAERAAKVAVTSTPLVWTQWASWLGLSGLASVALLAFSTQLTSYIAPNPLLWIVPLGLYLVSMIVCFDKEKWYSRPVWFTFFALAQGAAVYLMSRSAAASIPVQVVVYSASMFSICMICHGELVRMRPATDRLTLFYLLLALGGALGGVFVVLLAPIVFAGPWEFHLTLLAATCIVAVQTKVLLEAKLGDWTSSLVAGALTLSIGLPLAFNYRVQGLELLERSRNFYGTLSVHEFAAGKKNWHRTLKHGGVIHGAQMMMHDRKMEPVSYYEPGSGIWAAFRALDNEKGIRVGVAGLGVGTVAALAGAGDTVRFYEIDPDVVRIAESRFTFLRYSLAVTTTTIGDARKVLEREANEARGNAFDLLVLDAFNSDAPPVHLLTTEAMDIYLRNLAPGGVVAVNLTATHLDLSRVAYGLAAHAGMHAARIERTHGTWSDWLFLTTNEEFLRHPAIASAATLNSDPAQWVHWTDAYSNLVRIVR